ncbi:MAG: hypothetical protein P0S96_03845 [Simkaniaceae bacterium]|nr:hypothetical protein [Candidatus Sacchlamyda saccharinae]
MSVGERARGLDESVGEIVHDLGSIFTLPFEVAGRVIDRLQELPTVDKRTYRNDLPQLVEIAQRVFNAVRHYHQSILAGSSKWSDDIKFATEACIKIVLHPLSFTVAGNAIRNLIAKDILGNIMKAVSFIFFQIFHLVPYFIMVTGFKMINMVYVRYPVALLTGIMGSMLFLQLYFLYRLGKEVEITNKIMADGVALAAKRTSFKGLKNRIYRWGPPAIAAGAVAYTLQNGIPDIARHAINHVGEYLKNF